MKKIALWTFLSLTCALSAQDTIKYEIEPTIGYNSFDSNSKMESTFLYGIRASLYANEYYGYRLSYERADNVHYSSSQYFTQKNTDLERVSGQILISGEEEYNVIPYVLFGGGYEIISDETRYDVSQGYVEGGLGFKYHAHNNFKINLEGKVLKKFDTDDVDYMVNLGLGYMFSPSYHKPEIYQPSVLDKADKIYNSPTNNESLKKKEVFKPIENSSVKSSNLFEEEKEQTRESIPVVNSYEEAFSPEDSVQEQYYVQMAAFINSPNDKLLNNLESGGYPFDIRDAVREDKQMQLVIVGPFENFADAKLAYGDLKKIKRDAFITKL